MDRITRKDLKTDHFVTTVGHTLEGLSHHRKEVRRYTILGVVVLVAILATVSFFRWRAAERQTALNAMFRVMEAPVVEPGTNSGLSFATMQEKESAVEEAVKSLTETHSGSNEAAIAYYFRGTDIIEEGDLNKGIEHLDLAIKNGDSNTRALASFTKANALRSQGKRDEAEALLRTVLAKPGGLVTSDQVTLALAELIAQSKPDEAMKMLEPLRTKDGSAQRLAAKLITEIRNRQERAAAN